MSKEWDYSTLSKLAKANGGPENYINLVKQHSYENGRKEQGLVDLAIVSGVSLLTWGGAKLYEHIKSKKVSEVEAKQAEEKLIKGIKLVDEIDGVNESGESTKEEVNNDGKTEEVL